MSTSESAQTREKILKTAVTLVAEKGYSWISAKKLANEVGVSDSLLFKYFGTLDELFFEAYKYGCARLFNLSIPAGASSLNDFLNAYFQEFFIRIFEEHHQQTKFWLRTILERPDIYQKQIISLEKSGPFLELQFRLKDRRIPNVDVKIYLIRSYLESAMFRYGAQLPLPDKEEQRKMALLLLDTLAI